MHTLSAVHSVLARALSLVSAIPGSIPYHSGDLSVFSGPFHPFCAIVAAAALTFHFFLVLVQLNYLPTSVFGLNLHNSGRVISKSMTPSSPSQAATVWLRIISSSQGCGQTPSLSMTNLC